MLTTIWAKIRLNEVLLMSSFQTHLSPLEPLFLFASNLGDPQNGYVFYFVFCFIFISHSSALKVLWTSVLSEWINLMLKWLFSDQRPYWWAQEVKEYLISGNNSDYFKDVYNDFDYIKAINGLNLKQFSITCETGPGFPSGHVMCSAAVWFCLIIQIIKQKIIRSAKQRVVLRMTYISLLLMVSLARIYISAHFPDQCFVGLIAGIIVAVIVEKSIDINGLKLNGHLITSMLLIAISYLFNQLMTTFSGKSAEWSLELARKYCHDINNVKADTTPLYVVWRSAGTIVGIGIAFNYVLNRINKNNYLSLVKNKINFNVRLINAIVSTIAVVIYCNYSKPEPTLVSEEIYNFYIKSFFQFMFIPIIGLVSILLIDRIMKFYFTRVQTYSKR